MAFKALLPTERFRWNLVEQLVRALGDPADLLHGEAEELLGSVGPDARQANDDLFKRLASRDVAERARAAYAIARVNASAQDVDAVSGPLASAVTRALRQKDRAVWSALAPCVRRSPKAVVALLPDVTDLARHDPDESVRFGARDVLMLIGAERPPDAGRDGARPPSAPPRQPRRPTR